MCLCQRNPIFLGRQPFAVVRSGGKRRKKREERCNFSSLPSLTRPDAAASAHAYLDVDEVPALDGLADDAGLGQARVRHLERPEALGHLLVGVVLAHVDVDVVHPAARRPRRRRRRRRRRWRHCRRLGQLPRLAAAAAEFCS